MDIVHFFISVKAINAIVKTSIHLLLININVVRVLTVEILLLALRNLAPHRIFRHPCRCHSKYGCIWDRCACSSCDWCRSSTNWILRYRVIVVVSAWAVAITIVVPLRTTRVSSSSIEMCGCRSVVLIRQSLNNIAGYIVLYWWCLDRSKRNECQSSSDNREMFFRRVLLLMINQMEGKLNLHSLVLYTGHWHRSEASFGY
jgi:hypothetical protein